jgi:hypothetical protein
MRLIRAVVRAGLTIAWPFGGVEKTEDGVRVVRKAAIYEYNSPSIRNRKSLGVARGYCAFL